MMEVGTREVHCHSGVETSTVSGVNGDRGWSYRFLRHPRDRDLHTGVYFLSRSDLPSEKGHQPDLQGRGRTQGWDGVQTTH